MTWGGAIGCHFLRMEPPELILVVTGGALLLSMLGGDGAFLTCLTRAAGADSRLER